MSDAVAHLDPSPMDSAKNANETRLRLWPAVVIVAAIWLAGFWAAAGEQLPSKFFFGLVIAPVVGTLLMLGWWLFASRVRWSDGLLGVGAFIVAAAATVAIAGKNFPAMALILYSLKLVTTLWVVWLLLSWKLSWPVRRMGVLLIFFATGAYYSLLRVDGMDGSFVSTINWRWTPTSEEKLLNELKSSSKPSESSDVEEVADLTLQQGDWPGFRGPLRDGRLAGTHLQSDWDKTPPREVWRHRIGPSWSSCTVIGNRLFTQEQRGDEEFVTCYDAETGNEVWAHGDKTRFEEVVAGPGPRGTPTFHEGRIYALGANGRLNCLHSSTGKLIWAADIAADSKAAIPQWGFSSSPLVFHDLVSVFAGGPDGKSVLAYRIDSGELAWSGGEGLIGYCSTHAATIAGVEQVLIATEAGMISFEPDTGKLLWMNKWPVDQARVVQPAIISGTDILLGTGMNGGTRRLSVHREGEEWNVQELWTSKVIKPYYNDLVISGDCLYGFDGNIFMCVGLDDGKMKWRARGYGNGQVLLITDDDLLLIMTELGEVALVDAKPDLHHEIARVKMIEGKTWNHPVIAHGKLFVRNAEEIACFDIVTESVAQPVSVGSTAIPPRSANDDQ